jgi:amino acid permease
MDMSSQPGATDWQMFINLVNICLGAGILSVPWTFAGGSVVGGLVTSAVAMIWCTLTNIVIVEAGAKEKTKNLGALLAILPGGSVLGPLTNAVITCSNWLCLVAYMVIFADCLGALMPSIARNVAILIGCVLVLPLLFLDQSRLAFTSLLSVLANWYILLLLGGEAFEEKEPQRVCIAGLAVGDLTLFSVVVMAVSSQASVLPMYFEMRNRTARRFACLQWAATFAAWFLFQCVAVAGVLVYGMDVPSNVLVALPPSPLTKVAQIAVLIVVAGMYPLVLYPITAPLRQRAGEGSGKESTKGPSKHLPEHLRSPLMRLPSPGGPTVLEEPLLRPSKDGPAEDGDGASRTFFFGCVVVDVLAGLAAATGFDLGGINDMNGILTLFWFVVFVPAYIRWHLLWKSSCLNYLLFGAHIILGAVGVVCCILWKGNNVSSVKELCDLWSQ